MISTKNRFTRRPRERSRFPPLCSQPVRAVSLTRCSAVSRRNSMRWLAVTTAFSISILWHFLKSASRSRLISSSLKPWSPFKPVPSRAATYNRKRRLRRTRTDSSSSTIFSLFRSNSSVSSLILASSRSEVLSSSAITLDPNDSSTVSGKPSLEATDAVSSFSLSEISSQPTGTLIVSDPLTTNCFMFLRIILKDSRSSIRLLSSIAGQLETNISMSDNLNL